MSNPAYFLTVLLLSLFGWQSGAATGRLAYQDLPAIRSAVEAQLAAARADGAPPAAVTVGRLDPRLRLAACDTPLTTTQAPGARLLGATSVNVRCDGAAPWSIFVPVTIREQREVVIAARALPAGAQLGPDDVALAEMWVGDANAQHLTDLQAAIGKQLQRPVAAGAALPVNGLRSPRAIRRGAAITLALARGPIAVKVAGVALQDGAIGERIQARNNASRRIVEGIVGADGTIQVQ